MYGASGSALRRFRFAGAFVVLTGLLAAGICAAGAAPAAAAPKVTVKPRSVVWDTAHDVSPPLRDLAAHRIAPGADDPADEADLGPTAAADGPFTVDGALQSLQPAATIPSTQQNFEGLSNLDNITAGEFEVNPPEICSICGEEKEPEELSDLDGQTACLDCIAQANVSKNVSLQQLAEASFPTSTPPPKPRKTGLGLLVFILLALGVMAVGFFYIRRLRHRQETLRSSITSLKTEADNLLRAGKLSESLAHYEALLKQLQDRPLSDPQLVELYHETEKSAAAPYHTMIIPRLERVEALLLAGRNEDARGEFRELANFINAHTIQPEISVRQRIDRVTDQLKIPRIVRPNWRQEPPTIAAVPRPIPPATNVIETPQPAQQETPAPLVQKNPVPQAGPTPTTPPAEKPIRAQPPQPISVPDSTAQAQALEQIRTRFADKYAQRDALSRRALAHLLLITAQEPDTDPASRFVLLRESRDLAVRAGAR